jgi:hypothetical protein
VGVGTALPGYWFGLDSTKKYSLEADQAPYWRSIDYSSGSRLVKFFLDGSFYEIPLLQKTTETIQIEDNTYTVREFEKETATVEYSSRTVTKTPPRFKGSLITYQESGFTLATGGR